MINVVLGFANQVSGSASTSSNTPSSVLSSQSFESELSEAISNALTQLGIDPGSVDLTVEDSSGDNLGASQNSDSSSSAANASSAAAATPTSATAAANTPVVSTAVASTASAAAAAATTPTPVSTPTASSTATSDASFDNQYWSEQPPAVQQLQNMEDQGQRTQLAEQLASEGYSIDVPIMVWGWDPATTTQLRQSYGYTWVPSGLQPPIESAPGITVPGITPYNPNDPPAGSILV